MKTFLIFVNIFATFFVSHPGPKLSTSSLGSVSKVDPDWAAFPYCGPRHFSPGSYISLGFLPAPSQGLLLPRQICSS